MKKLLGTIAALIIAATTFAQISISGTVTGKQNKPLSNATVILRVGLKEKTSLTNNSGVFQFSNITQKHREKFQCFSVFWQMIKTSSSKTSQLLQAAKLRA